MRNLVCACAAFALAAAASASPVRAAADPGARTVSETYIVWTDLAGATDAAATAAQRSGDAALAQQQFLLGAMIRRAAGEFRNAEQYSLGVRVADLPAPIPDRVKAAEQALETAPAVTDASAAGALKGAQRSVNALIDAVMTTRRYPILYGMLTRDLARDPADAPADLTIYGYDIRDKAIGKAPVVSVGGEPLPESAVAVEGDDALLITLPAAVRTAIGFAPSPCVGRNTFPVRVRAFYALTRGFWPLNWKEEQSTIADFNALATPTVYAVNANYSVDAVRTSVAEETFETKPSFVAADCGQSAATTLTVDLPRGARDVTCRAQWVETSSVASSTADCEVAPDRATARGELSGRPKLCSSSGLCSCLSSAHGWLQAKGTYRHDVSTLVAVDHPLSDIPNFSPDGAVSAPLPLAPGETLRNIALAFTRRACAQVLDTLDMPTPDGQGSSLAVASRNGLFRAKYNAGRLLVGGAGADAFNAPSQ